MVVACDHVVAYRLHFDVFLVIIVDSETVDLGVFKTADPHLLHFGSDEGAALAYGFLGVLVFLCEMDIILCELVKVFLDCVLESH